MISHASFLDFFADAMLHGGSDEAPWHTTLKSYSTLVSSRWLPHPLSTAFLPVDLYTATVPSANVDYPFVLSLSNGEKEI